MVGQPRDPPAYLLQYGTDHYVLYNPQIGNTGPPVNEKFRSFGQYDQYTLYMNPVVERAENIPSSGVRLDDMTVAFVLVNCGQKTLHANWPAEFDTKGMVRATRVSLGHAAKFWKNEGDVDVDGNVVPEGGAGYYYKWWRGLHCLCGKEGLDAKIYLIRPSFETFKCQGFGFKVSSCAIIQFPSGDPADSTFASSTTSTISTASKAT